MLISAAGSTLDPLRWVPWVIAGLVAAAALGQYLLSRRSSREASGHQRHQREVDWLDVARGELGAKLDAAKSETLLAINEVGRQAERLTFEQQRFQDGNRQVLAQIETVLNQVRNDVVANHRQLFAVLNAIMAEVVKLQAHAGLPLTPEIIDLSSSATSEESERRR